MVGCMPFCRDAARTLVLKYEAGRYEAPPTEYPRTFCAEGVPRMVVCHPGKNRFEECTVTPWQYDYAHPLPYVSRPTCPALCNPPYASLFP